MTSFPVRWRDLLARKVKAAADNSNGLAEGQVGARNGLVAAVVLCFLSLLAAYGASVRCFWIYRGALDRSRDELARRLVDTRGAVPSSGFILVACMGASAAYVAVNRILV